MTPAKEVVASAESLGPDILEMITKAAEKQKKKKGDKGDGGAAQQAIQEVATKARLKAEGSLGHLLHDEVCSSTETWSRDIQAILNFTVTTDN